MMRTGVFNNNMGQFCHAQPFYKHERRKHKHVTILYLIIFLISFSEKFVIFLLIKASNAMISTTIRFFIFELLEKKLVHRLFTRQFCVVLLETNPVDFVCFDKGKSVGLTKVIFYCVSL